MVRRRVPEPRGGPGLGPGGAPPALFDALMLNSLAFCSFLIDLASVLWWIKSSQQQQTGTERNH